jgi:TPR repeat protein
MELYARAADFGNSQAHHHLANIYHDGGNLKKAKFHYEAAAMAGHEDTRNNLGYIEFESRNMERAMKHWKIGASAGGYTAMHHLRICFKNGLVSRESIESSLAAYNSSCAEFRCEARDTYIRAKTETI